MIVVYTLSSRLFGHSAVAFTSTRLGPKFFSWVNTSGSEVWHDRVVIPGDEPSCCTWSDIIHRIEIPTQNDGNRAVSIDENLAVEHMGRYVNDGNKNCAESVYDLLERCGASAYDRSWGSRKRFVWFPGRITWHAENIRDAAIRQIGRGNVRWPADSEALRLFFRKDMRLRNSGTWRVSTGTAGADTGSGDESRSPLLSSSGTIASPPVDMII